MAILSRRHLMRGAAAAGAAVGTCNILARRASAAEFVYKFGNNLPVNHPMNSRVQEALPKILEESNGKLEVRLFPNNQLGGDTDMLSQLRSGALEMFTLSGVILSTMSKPMAMSGVAFAFPTYDNVWAAMDGDVGNHLRGLAEKLNLHALDKMFDNGFRQITSSTRPINTPDDLKGFKIRVPVSPMWTSLFQALEAAPTGINFSEVYSALQTHIVDGQENPLTLISLAKLFEVQKYVSMTNHMWDGFHFLINGRAWKALSPELQDVLARNINAAAMMEREDLVQLNHTVAGDLKARGMIFNEPDPTAFRAALSKAGYYKQWKETFGDEAWTLLEKYSGPLA
jgi:TRAP-type transport system periplasmic protein